MLAFDHDNDDIDVTQVHEWNIAHLIFASFGTCALYAFAKIPLMQFYGSGWSIVMFVGYLVILTPIMYVQMRLGSQYRRSLISVFGKFWPFGRCVAIAFLVRNMLTLIIHSIILMLSMSYVAFSLYRCDPRICIANFYMWSSCQNQWSSTQCIDSEKKVTVGPTPEDDFFFRFVFGQIDAFQYMQMPSQGGFPSWWAVYAVNTVFLIVTWLIIWLCTFFGVRGFGYVLYVLGPLAIVGLFVMVGWAYAAVAPLDQQSIQNTFYIFYSQFATTLQSSLTGSTWQPLEYGFLGMLVQMCFSMQLWSGQYTSMGKFVGYGRRTMKLIWLVPLITFGALAALPTVIICAMLGFGYDQRYFESHLKNGYPAPFIIFAHLFSRTGISPAIAAVFFVTLFLFTLISLGLLILTCTDNIVDSMRKSSPAVERNVTVARRLCTSLMCLFFCLLSVFLITKAGTYWIVLIDSFIDRLMCVIIPFAAAGYLVAYKRSTKGGAKRCMVIAAFVFAAACCTGAYAWFLVTQPYTTYSVYGNYQFPLGYLVIGWLVAACPLVIGLVAGVIISLKDAEGNSSDRCRQLCCGYQQNDLPYFPRGEESETDSKRL